MTDEPRPGDVFEIDPSESEGLLTCLPWWLILTIAFVVTELTAHPAIGASVLCLKFGWDDFRTAAWLRSRDPNQERGTACMWFYFASGTWRVFLWSFALIVVACLFLKATQPPQVRDPNGNLSVPPEIITCLCMCLASFAVATVLTLIAAGSAWKRQVKVWISGPISQSRRLNEWPPRPIPGKLAPTNLLKSWLIGTGAGFFLMLFVSGSAVSLAIVKVMLPGVGNNQKSAVLSAVVVGVGLLLIAAMFILLSNDRIFSRIEANSPADCWPDEAADMASDPSD